MAIRINEYVVTGELRNTSRNSVNGHIAFGPKSYIRIELTGNFAGQFEGKHFRFRVNRPDSELVSVEDLPEHVAMLEFRQIGAIGSVELRQVRIPCVPIEEFLRRSKLGEMPPCDLKDCLYLEWFSQNGRVVAELTDLELEFISNLGDDTFIPHVEPILGLNENNNFDQDDSEDSDHGGLSITSIGIDDEGNASIEEVDLSRFEKSDEYGLFSADLDEKIRQSLASDPEPIAPEIDGDDSAINLPFDPDGSTPPATRSWDEVIPGIDPETKALYESWDEIYHGGNEDPVMPLFESFNLPDPDSLATDEQAAPYLDLIIARLATFSISIDLCEHMTPLSAYRILMTEILPEASVHPNLAATEIVQHFCTWESCPQCEAEFEAEYESRESERE